MRNPDDGLLIPWTDWPEPSIPSEIKPDPVPLHEREEGLLDEEVLPLEADWLKGPIKTAEQG